MFYYITIYLYIPFGVFPLPCLFCLLLPSELQTYAVLLFSLRGFATAYLLKIATVFCHAGGFLSQQSCNFTQVYVF